MSGDLQPIGKLLIVLGAVVTGIGALLAWGPRMPWLGHLPGDLVIKRDGVWLYVPLASSLLVSALLSVLLWLIGRFRP